MLERDGQKLVVHPNKSGYIFVYDRSARVKNVWRITEHSNCVKDIDPKTGELIGRRDFSEGKVAEPLCPHISASAAWRRTTTRRRSEASTRACRATTARSSSTA